MWKASTSPTDPKSPTTAEGNRQKNPGRRFAQIVKLKPEHVEAYKKCHASVWPEVLKQIKDCNIQDCMKTNYPPPPARGFLHICQLGLIA